MHVLRPLISDIYMTEKLALKMLEPLHIPSQLDSQLLCNAMGHPGWTKNTYYNTACIFELFLLKQEAHGP